VAAALLITAGSYAFYRYRLAQAVKVVRVRERIARDLHDEIGSTLSSVSLFSSVAQKKAAGKAPEASELLGRITESTTQVLEAMNDIVWAVNADNDDMASVIKRMHAFAVNVTEARGCNCTFTPMRNLKSWRLEMTQRKNLYLIFKEAVNNAMKYSGCANLRVDWCANGPAIVLRVSDDGKGFDQNMHVNAAPAAATAWATCATARRRSRARSPSPAHRGKGTTVELRFVPGEGKRSLEPMTPGAEQAQ
jgi:signal transduction histidine kinase